MDQMTIGRRLQELRERAGMSLDAVARAAGYAGASSVQAYFDDAYNPEGGLSIRVGQRLIPVLVGKGEPPIAELDIYRLVYGNMPPWGNRDGDEITPPMKNMPTLRGQPKDVPVYGTALGADVELDSAGQPAAIELTTVEMGEVLTFVRRPPGIDAEQKVYAVFVVGSSMEPRYRAGDPVFVDPHRPPSIGDDVIVQVSQPDGYGDQHIVAGLIKTLARRTARLVELEQYNPGTRFALETSSIAAIHRIIPWRECFGI